MEEEKTTLQKIKEQLEKKATRAIVQSIENGAKCETLLSEGAYIDGVYLTPKFGTDFYGLILNIRSPEIDQLFKPTKDDLKKRAEKLRAELGEIENQLKSE